MIARFFSVTYDLILPKQMLFGLPWIIAGCFLHGVPSGIDALLLFLCFACTRAGGMTINRIVDRKFDALNPRTALRAIPQGHLSVRSGWLFVGITFAIALFCAYRLHLQQYAWFLLCVILVYSFLKRCTYLCHFALGVIYFFLPVSGALLVTQSIDALTLFLGLSAFFQVSGSDILYAIQDTAFDTKMGLHSIPALVGTAKARKIAFILHMVSAACFFVAACYVSLSFMAVAILYGLIFYRYSASSMDFINSATSLLILFGTIWEVVWNQLS